MLPETGRISMADVWRELNPADGSGGSVVDQEISSPKLPPGVELESINNLPDGPISLGDTNVRELACINDEQISLNDLHGKSNYNTINFSLKPCYDGKINIYVNNNKIINLIYPNNLSKSIQVEKNSILKIELIIGRERGSYMTLSIDGVNIIKVGTSETKTKELTIINKEYNIDVKASY